MSGCKHLDRSKIDGLAADGNDATVWNGGTFPPPCVVDDVIVGSVYDEMGSQLDSCSSAIRWEGDPPPNMGGLLSRNRTRPRIDPVAPLSERMPVVRVPDGEGFVL